MEVFFLLAGFFARLVVLKRGTRAFIWNRFQRILVPFVLGWLVLYPLVVVVWIAGAQKSGNYSFIIIPEEARDFPLWKLWIGFFLSGGMFRTFNLTHLWFLHQLLVIYALFGAARWVCLRWDPMGQAPALVDKALKPILVSRGQAWFFVIPTVGILFLMPGWTVSTPFNSLIPELGPTVMYGFCFVLGWFLHRQAHLLPQFANRWAGNLLVAVGAIIGTAFFGDWIPVVGLGTAPEGVKRLVYSVLYATAMWGFTIGFLGLFLSRIQCESRFWRYVADSSYWVYLANLPLVVALQVWVAFWPIGWPLKYLVILGIALPLLYLSYHYCVRSTFIGRQLNGRRYPFTSWPPWIHSPHRRSSNDT
jgi:peptidoglycan/LPS O-acetylase OafA/YrhL